MHINKANISLYQKYQCVSDPLEKAFLSQFNKVYLFNNFNQYLKFRTILKIQFEKIVS